MIGARVDPAPSVEAKLVFVGYGLRAPEIGYDDFTGLDGKGKIAVYLAGAPSNLSGSLARALSIRGRALEDPESPGIIGAISLANPKHMDIPWSPRRPIAPGDNCARRARNQRKRRRKDYHHLESRPCG